MAQKPAIKKRRVDPNSFDSTLPDGWGYGQVSALGKRAFADLDVDEDDDANMKEAVPVYRGYSQQPNSLHNDEMDEDMDVDMDGNGGPQHNLQKNWPNVNQPEKPQVIEWTRGKQVDIQVEDEHNEKYWTTGTITKICGDQVTIHVSRHGAEELPKNSSKLAAVGTHTDNYY